MQNIQISIYSDYINMLIQGHAHSVLCHSKAGFGKTFTTINLLKHHGVAYSYNSGVATAVALFKLLFENRNNILILDDIETIFQDDRIINLLKSALWDVDGKRIVTYKTTSKVLEDYPDSFEYKGKIIILANELRGRNDESYKALISRCLKFELVYTFDELKDMSKSIVYNNCDLSFKEKVKIVAMIENDIKPQHNFNFRLLMRLISFVKYNYDKAELLFLNSLDVDDETEAILNIIQKYDTTSMQVLKYTELTGKSRITFFRKKKKLKAEGVI